MMRGRRRQHTLEEADSYWKSKLTDEALRILLTYPMLKPIVEVLEELPDVRGAILAGGRALPYPIHISEYTSFRQNSAIKLKGKDLDYTFHVNWNNPTERIFNDEEFVLFQRMVDLIFMDHRGRDFDICPLIIDNSQKGNEQGFYNKFYDKLKKAINLPEKEETRRIIGGTFGLAPEQVIGLTEELYDLKPEFVLTEKAVSEYLRRRRVEKDMFPRGLKEPKSIRVYETKDGKIIVSTKPSKVRLVKTEVSTDDVEDGVVYIKIRPSTAIPPYFVETLERGGVLFYENNLDSRLKEETFALGPGVRDIDSMMLEYRALSRRLLGLKPDLDSIAKVYLGSYLT